MKKPILWKYLVYSLFLLSSCSDSNDSLALGESDYLIFGHFYGECGGEWCVEIFKLENKLLSEDTADIYPNSTDYYIGNYIELDQDVLDSVKDLTSFFPEKLLSEKDKVLGTPDAGDWGGLYIEHKRNGVRKFWLLDQKKDNVPSYLHSFIDKVNEKISYINNKGRCNLMPDTGNCEAAIPKYYFDQETKTCKEFLWGGCDGVVPFETMEDCQDCL